MNRNEITITPSTRGTGFDITSPRGTDWALTRESAESWADTLVNGVRHEDFTDEEWDYIQSGRSLG